MVMDAHAGRSNDSPAERPALLEGAAAAEMSQALADQPSIEKVVIAIHGIGSQRRSDTIRSVATQFGTRTPRVPLMSLGHFSVENEASVKISRLEVEHDDPRAGIGFVEVYWADIPQAVVKAEDTLEDTKAWGRTIVSQAEAAYNRRVASGHLSSKDFGLAAGVVDEIIESVRVFENLTAVAGKMGIFEFEVGKLLRDYIDDVQVFTEFKRYRDQILARLHKTIASVIEQFSQGGTPPEVYLVAHSEGSVVAFYGLLQALAGVAIDDPKAPGTPIPTEWIRHVRGFMTIGSPIDKHLVLWDKLFRPFNGRLACTSSREGVVFPSQTSPRLVLAQPIPWRNYYDYGDPIGFKLDTARRFLREQDCLAFDFTSDHDFGFTRYTLPGKAHNDYWADPDVFGHFIDHVVMPKAGDRPGKPADRPLSRFISHVVPYGLIALLHVLAVFILFKATKVFFGDAMGVADVALSVFPLATLLLGVTIAARLPRLTKALVAPGVPARVAAASAAASPSSLTLTMSAEAMPTPCAATAAPVKLQGVWRWRVLAVLAFATGAAVAYSLLPAPVANFLSTPLVVVLEAVGFNPPLLPGTGKLLLIAAAAIVALTGWKAGRSPGRGRRNLLICGALTVLVMIGGQIAATGHEPQGSADTASGSMQVVQGSTQSPAGPPTGNDRGKENPQIWPVLLAGAAYLYLWWLGILLFDLVFIWHRYIRQSVAEDALSAWHGGKDLQPTVLGGS